MIQAWLPNAPRHPNVRAEYTWTTAPRKAAGSGARPVGSRVAVCQVAAVGVCVATLIARGTTKRARISSTVRLSFMVGGRVRAEDTPTVCSPAGSSRAAARGHLLRDEHLDHLVRAVG